MMETDEKGTLQDLKERRKTCLEPVIRAYGGRVVKLLGDGVLIEFPSAVNAVEGAVELQRKMAEANAGVADKRQITLRIGIDLGDVIEEGSDIYGEGVNVAARLEPLTEPGGICISDKVHAEINGKVNVVAKDLGFIQLKNIGKQVRAFNIAPERAARSEAQPSANKEFTSIAVLPFTNLSGSAELDYFADGVTEDTITELSRYKNLAVVARNTTLTYKGRSVDVAEVGASLAPISSWKGAALHPK